MPTCIVPGCTSGYSSNPGKIHFFTIPKDPETAKQWKIAVKRTEESIKTRRAVCEKHFAKDDILWQRELLDPDGKVLGVSQYKVPRLRKGTVPAQFSWNDWVDRVEPDQVQMKPIVQGEKDIASNAAVDVLPSGNNDCRIPVADTIGRQELDVPSVHSTSLIQMEQGSVKTHVLNFKDIVTTDLDLPLGWLKQITGCAKTQLIFFFIHKTTEVEGRYETFILKDVTVTKDLSIQVRVLGKQLDLCRFNITCPITDLHELQNFLVAIHRLNVCRGCWGPPVKIEIEQLNCEKLNKDSSDTWRHVECPMLLSEKQICEHCSKAKNTIDKSLRRYIQGKVRERRKKNVDSRELKMELLKMQSRYRSAMRTKRLLRQKIGSLKQEVFEMRQKMAKCTSKDVEQCIESGKIPQNQIHVLNHIIEAAKHTNSKGRNYSDEWILLCMLLHMKSPAGYEFLRCNEVLPLPSVRTVRRYFSNIKNACGFDSEFFEDPRVQFHLRSSET